MFNFMSMNGNYEQRKVANFTKDGIAVDTAAVTDSDKLFETAIRHQKYNHGDWIVVELYNTKKQAEDGHGKWVEFVQQKNLPETLKDVSSASIAKLSDMSGSDCRERLTTEGDSPVTETEQPSWVESFVGWALLL
jgi:hypothetical protein